MKNFHILASLCFLVGTACDCLAANSESVRPFEEIRLDGQLLRAIEDLDPNAVKAALRAGANPNCSFQKDEKKCSAIRLSILSVEISKDDYLHRSADEKCKEVLDLLISNGASLQYNDQDALYHSVRKGLLEVTELLLEAGANPKLEVYYKKPIELAIERARDDIVELLIEHGAKKVNQKDARQLRFIYLAGLIPRIDFPEYEYNHPIIEMQKLLDHGAEVNSANRAGQRALHNAFNSLPSFEKYSTVMFLLQNGANPNLLARERATEKFSTVFHRFVFYSGMSIRLAKPFKTSQPLTEIRLFLDALLRNGANISLVDSNGKTPLHIAAKYDNLVFAKILIKNVANVNIQDKDGKTPLDYAESAEMIKLLKSQGAKEE